MTKITSKTIEVYISKHHTYLILDKLSSDLYIGVLNLDTAEEEFFLDLDFEATMLKTMEYDRQEVFDTLLNKFSMKVFDSRESSINFNTLVDTLKREIEETPKLFSSIISLIKKLNFKKD